MTGNLRVRPGLLTALLVCAGCATTTGPGVSKDAIKAEQEIQQEYALENLVRYQAEMDQKSWPLLTRTHDLCDDKLIIDPGLRVVNSYAFPKEYRKAAKKNYAITESLSVLNIVPGSPAENAGFEVGDRILAVNGERPDRSQYAMDSYRKMLRKVHRREEALSYRIRRNESEMVIETDGETACDYPVLVSLDPEPNAYATGSEVVVHSGLMNFLKDDRQLAFVVGHELAHNVMGHRGKTVARSLVGLVADVTLGTYGLADAALTSALSPGLEAEADYVGLYFVARAGIDVKDAEEVWRRMSAEMGGATRAGLFRTHPTAPERFVRLREASEEIQGKIAAGEPLVPER